MYWHVIPVLPIALVRKRFLGTAWPAHWKDALAKAFGRKRQINGDQLADVIEVVAQRLDEWTLEQWSDVAITLAPEMFGTPKPSIWPTDAPPGSYEKIRRLRRRARKGLDLWQHQDDSDYATQKPEPPAKSISGSQQQASHPKPTRTRLRQRVDTVRQTLPATESAVPDVREPRKNNRGQPGRSHPAAARQTRPPARPAKPSADVPQLPRGQNVSRGPERLKKSYQSESKTLRKGDIRL